MFTTNKYDLTSNELEPDLPATRLMFDLQTSGGIFGAVPHMQTKHCLQRLHESSFSHATVVGRISEQPGLLFKKAKWSG